MAKNIRRIKRRDEQLGVDVQEAAADYLQHPNIKKLSPRTQEEYEQELGVFASWCATHTITQKNRKWTAIKTKTDPIMLHQVNEHVIYLFLEYLKQTHKPNKAGAMELSTYTLAGYVRVIKSFLNWCLLDEQYCDQVKSIVVQRIEKPDIIETIIEVFTPNQIEALFRACDEQDSEHLQLRDKAILAVLLDTGVRATELVNLTIGHVFLDAKDAHIRILGKGNKWGEIGMGEQARRHVQKYIRLYREPTVAYEVRQKQSKASDAQLGQIVKQELQHAYLFVNRTGNKLTRNGLYQLIDRMGERAHIEGVRCSPHTLRHSFACMFIRNGGDIYTLSKLLRHSSVKVTETYLKALQQAEARHRAKSVLDNLK